MLNICNCWSKTELNSAEVYISVGNGFHRCPAAIVSMQKPDQKKVNWALGMRSKKSNIPHNSTKSNAVSSITFSEATEPDWSQYVA